MKHAKFVVPVFALVLSCWSGLSAARADDGVIGADEALKRAGAGEITVIDVRSPGEWRQTGVPKGAKTVTIHDPAGMDGFVAQVERAMGGKKDAPVAVICASGNRSSRAAAALESAGFTNVLNIREGMFGNPRDGPGWLRRSLPVER